MEPEKDNTVAEAVEKKTEESKPIVEYRIEPMRIFEINKEHSERAARARTLAILRSSLFGRKRYQDIYLNCSLNSLFNALRIAHFLHSKVPNLALIIRFVPIKIIEVFSNGQHKESHQITDRKKVEIKLTAQPNELDKAEPGYNAGFSREDIVDPIEELFNRNREQKGKGEGEQDKPRKKEKNSKRENRDNTRENRDNQGNSDKNKGRANPRNDKNDHQNRRNKRDEEARRERVDHPNKPEPKKKTYRALDQDNLEDERDNYRNENRTENRKTRGGGNPSKGSNNERAPVPVQSEHKYDPKHLTADPRQTSK